MSVIGFKTHFPHEVDFMESPTYFQERILKCCIDYNIDAVKGGIQEYIEKNDSLDRDRIKTMAPKIHTIRKKGKAKRKIGSALHPSIGVRTKEQFQFAPELSIKKVEDIEFIWDDLGNTKKSLYIKINDIGFEAATTIGGMLVWYSHDLVKLASNDGFSDIKKFLKWFPESEKYDLIYWVDYDYSIEQEGD